MDDTPANIFDAAIEDHFGLPLEDFDEHELDLPSHGINPQLICTPSDLTRPPNVGNGGSGRQATWNAGSTAIKQATWNAGSAAIKQGPRKMTKPAQRPGQHHLRSSSMRPSAGAGEKSSSMLGQEMRHAAQRVRVLGSQLLDRERYSAFSSHHSRA